MVEEIVPTETLPLLRGDRARPVRLPPVGDLGFPVPEPAESFFQAEHGEERGFLPGQGAEYWYRTPPAPNQSYYCPNCKLLLTRVDEFRTP